MPQKRICIHTQLDQKRIRHLRQTAAERPDPKRQLLSLWRYHSSPLKPRSLWRYHSSFKPRTRRSNQSKNSLASTACVVVRSSVRVGIFHGVAYLALILGDSRGIAMESAKARARFGCRMRMAFNFAGNAPLSIPKPRL